jgi:hypothetical protein
MFLTRRQIRRRGCGRGLFGSASNDDRRSVDFRIVVQLVRLVDVLVLRVLLGGALDQLFRFDLGVVVVFRATLLDHFGPEKMFRLIR